MNQFVIFHWYITDVTFTNAFHFPDTLEPAEEAMATKTIRKRGRPRSSGADGAGRVRALDRGLALLKALARSDDSTLGELALQVGMPVSTAHRLVNTLQAHGFVAFDEAAQAWRIGVDAFRVGSSFLRHTDLVGASHPVLRRLMQETEETANLAVADDGNVVFVSQVETQLPIRAFLPTGSKGPLHASGIGKALLSQMPRATAERVLEKKGLPALTPKTIRTAAALFAELEVARERGWALDDEEGCPGMRCVASPVFNAAGYPIAGVSVSGPTARLTDTAIAEFGPKVRRAASEITECTGGRLPSPVMPD